MGDIIDMASFEHLRRSNSDDRYTCPKTNVTFPHIYKVMVPDGDLVNDVRYSLAPAAQNTDSKSHGA